MSFTLEKENPITFSVTSKSTHSSAKIKLSLDTSTPQPQVKIEVVESVLAEKGQEWSVRLAHTRQNILLRSTSETRIYATAPSTRYPYGEKEVVELKESGNSFVWTAPRRVHANWGFTFDLVCDVENNDPYSAGKVRENVQVSDGGRITVNCAL